jgi:hypothetical protein
MHVVVCGGSFGANARLFDAHQTGLRDFPQSAEKLTDN